MSLPVYFAPLQGYTDSVYRRAHASLFGGIAAYYTPFVRIEKGDFRRKDLRDIAPENNVGIAVVPQAIASEPDELRRIVDAIAGCGYRRIDINLGCPFPLLARRHKGAGILPFPDEVERLLNPLKEYPDFSAVNYHRWKICKAGEVLGRHEQVRVYEFLKEPLIRRFGEEWYNELCEAAEAYLQEYGK